MAADSSVYPRTYRYSPIARMVLSLFGLMFLALGLGLIGFFPAATTIRPDWLRGMHMPTHPGLDLILLFVGFGLAMTVLGLAVILPSLRGKLVLFADRLEYTGVIATRLIRRDEIAKVRNIRQQIGQLSMTLVLKGRPNVIICNYGKADPDFFAWFEGIENADATAHNAKIDALFNNHAFGATPEAREKAVKTQGRFINRLGWVALAVGFWGFIFPYPYRLCIPIQIGIPILVLLMALLSHGRWAMSEDPKSGRLSLISLYFMPCMTLALHAFMDMHLLDWELPVLYAVSAAALLIGLVAAIEQRLTVATAVGLAILFLPYAWGALVEANTLFDTTTGTVYAAQVQDTRISTGKYTTYYLKLTPWGPYHGTREYSVRGYVYNHAHKGDTVCAYLAHGALGWANYQIDQCPGKS